MGLSWYFMHRSSYCRDSHGKSLGIVLGSACHVCRTGCRACLQQDNCNSNQVDTSSVCFNIALLSPAQNSKALTACEKGGLWREGATLVEDMQQKVVVPNQLSHWDQAILRVATHGLVNRLSRFFSFQIQISLPHHLQVSLGALNLNISQVSARPSVPAKSLVCGCKHWTWSATWTDSQEFYQMLSAAWHP